MSSRKREAEQRAAEDRILQYRNVVAYLKTKTDETLPAPNTLSVAKVLIQGGWINDGAGWVKGDNRFSSIVQAGIQEFGDRYETLRKEHLRKSVASFSQ